MAWYSFWRKPKPVPTPTPVPVPTPIPLTKIYGLAVDTFAEVAAFNTKAGRPINTFTIYQSFFWDNSFPTAIANTVSSAGVTPLIVWEPWEPNGVVLQPKYALRTIVNGNHDTLIKNWAAGVKAYNKPIMLSFAPEMNGNWTPWGDGVNGNTQAEYVAAYRHVVDLFRAAGVTNVKWVWQANVGVTLSPLYPGDSYVDLVAVDGYNWDTTSPEQVFGDTFNRIRSFTQKPIYIGETSCREYSGKAQWITDFFTMVKNHNLLGFVWFNINKENDWRIDSSAAALTAFKQGISTF